MLSSASPRLLTVKEVAARLRTSTAMVYGFCERGELPYVRISTHAIRVAVPDLADLICRRSKSEGEPRGVESANVRRSA